MQKYIFINDICNEQNLAKGTLALRYDTENKVLSIVDNVNGEIVDNLTNDSLQDYVSKEELNRLNEKIAELSGFTSCTWEVCGKLNSKEELNAKQPIQGHIWLIDDKEYLGNGSEWIELGVDIDLTNYATKEELNNYATLNDIPVVPEVPTKLSQLENDVPYLSAHQDLSDYAKKSELFSGNYDDLNGKPTIPTKTSQLTNDSGFLTEHQDLSDYAKTSDLTSLISEEVDPKFAEVSGSFANGAQTEEDFKYLLTKLSKVIRDVDALKREANITSPAYNPQIIEVENGEAIINDNTSDLIVTSQKVTRKAFI